MQDDPRTPALQVAGQHSPPPPNLRALPPNPAHLLLDVTDGMPCYRVDLGPHLDQRTAARLVLPPRRCLILSAEPWTTWTGEGLRTLAWRIAGRAPLPFELLPEPLGDALAVAVLAVLDVLAEGA